MQKLKIKSLLSLSILSLIQYGFVESVCVLKYPKNIETAPIYVKQLGKYTLYLPANGKYLELSSGETIEAICRTNFSPITYDVERKNYYGSVTHEEEVLYDQVSISLLCIGEKLYFENSTLVGDILECTKLYWSVYDADETYEWCEKNQNAKTFLLAAKSNKDHHILAGICFNLDEWSLLTITYNVTNSGQKYNMEMLRDITKTQLKSFQSLGDYLWDWKTNYFDLADTDLQEQLTELTKINSWLNLANYEISSIVQGDSYENYFSEYVNILNIIWWRNLRVGNWRLFMNTLENYAYKNSFQLYTGTSGVVKVPTKNAVENYILEVKNGNLNETVPAYIWTYLTSTDNLNEDFIIVGYNSPYVEWFKVYDVVFCPTICSQIPWLKEIYSSFRYATAGIMFCCSPDFVRQNNYLHGFPMDILIERTVQKQIESTSTLSNSLDVENTEQSYTSTVDVDDNNEA